jgi:histidinol phosphatase-like PHP family hydrolase
MGTLDPGLGTLIDYHVHLGEDLKLADAVALAAERHMRFGIVEHPGAAFGIESDDDIGSYAKRLREHGLYVGLQPMHLDWAQAFSDTALRELDYVLMDADTVPLDDGSFLHIWRHDNFIWDVETFVERYRTHIVNILSNEPIDIFARPTYLPVSLARHYDEIWTEARMREIIELAVARDIALEIAEQVRVPSLRFIQMAKEAGAKFTFGTNARDHHAGDFHYCLQMAERAALTQEDLFIL